MFPTLRTPPRMSLGSVWLSIRSVCGTSLGVVLDGIDLVTITMDDKFTLRDYGIRRGQHGGGRVQAVLKTTDVESP